MSKTFFGGFLKFTQSIFEISTGLTILDIYEKNDIWHDKFMIFFSSLGLVQTFSSVNILNFRDYASKKLKQE